jgi:uncharacterized protein (TIGR03032 family)
LEQIDGAEAVDPDGTAENRRMMKIVASPGFKGFLVDNTIAIAFTTYQSGRLMLAGGHRSSRRMHFSELKLQRPMGLALKDGMLAVALRNQIVTYVNALRGARIEGDAIDAMYMAQSIDLTTDIDTHDIAFGGDGALYFINTRFSCLCTTSREFAFKPIWKPDFISALSADDRCHLNGLAMRDGKPAFVTVAARTDEGRKWKENRVRAGAVIDIATDEIVCDGLTMPHSPRWHMDRLWVLNSGHGELCTVDVATGALTPVIFLPGYLRGLSFAGKYAIIGLSKPRENTVFDGLPLQQAIEQRDLPPSCGIAIVDTETGTLAHMLTFEGDVTELYDTGVLPGLDQPMILPPEGDAKYRIVTIEPGLPAPDTPRPA